MPAGEQGFEFEVVSATMHGLVLKTMMNTPLSKNPQGNTSGRLRDMDTDLWSFYGVPSEGFFPAAASSCKHCARYEIDMYKMINSSRMDQHTQTRVSVPPPSDLNRALRDLVVRCQTLYNQLLGCGRRHEKFHVDVVAKLRSPAVVADGALVRAAQAAFPDTESFRWHMRERRLQVAVKAWDGRVIKVGLPPMWLRLLWRLLRAVMRVVGPSGRVSEGGARVAVERAVGAVDEKKAGRLVDEKFEWLDEEEEDDLLVYKKDDPLAGEKEGLLVDWTAAAPVFNVMLPPRRAT
ncbi:hypothetical protein VTO73DRAFT_11142 [Trametes versicolor]